MRWLLVAILAVLFLFVLAAIAIPGALISDGVATFEGDERWAAEAALTQARSLCGLHEPLDGLAWRKTQVIEAHVAGEADPDVSPRQRRNYDARVRLHTYFGIPARNITIVSGRAVSCQ